MILKWAVVTFLTVPLVLAPFQVSNRWFAGFVYRQIRLKTVLQQIPVLTAVLLVRAGCMALIPWSSRSVYSLFMDVGTGNINMMPIQVRYLGPVYCALLLFSLPSFALAEEQMFREGADTVRRGVLKSLAFGFAHCVVGVSFASGFGLSMGGLWFWHQYRTGGIIRSTVHHTAYNALVVSIVFVLVLILTFFPAA